LLKSRSGIRKTDSVVNYFIRCAIQTGSLATIWAAAELITWFKFRNTAIYSIFQTTVGLIYTHALYQTLLSRARLREQL
ncbi:hypothetical protein BC834DRAFT_798377, partial [Gloeopeniophorella convolvens]